ncbi:MAG: fructose-1,6-bisphosphatase [Ruminococcus sp.]|nr:fructose-1,6-bisphosphatase [Ruminococcus sp.]
MEKERYFELLAEKYPTQQAVCREIINLNAILNLPKGTEHFISDIHGEYEAFCHILNNCSGVIAEKAELVFKDTLSQDERRELCTLIYYPKEKLSLIKSENKNSEGWYRTTLNQLIALSRVLASKYTRSKVRKALPQEFSYIIDELIHIQEDEDNNQIVYHEKILDTIIQINSADDFVIALSSLIKRLAVDHLHIVGDIFDRGACADKILDMLMNYHSLDIEWGNHDILWMGACSGNKACIATVLYNNIKCGNTEILENSYGISLRNLFLFAKSVYGNDIQKSVMKAISVILFKLEGQIIMSHPEYEMEDRLLLHKIDLEKGTIQNDRGIYKLNDNFFPTLDIDNPYKLSHEEKEIMDEFYHAFTNSHRLNKHIKFLYDKGSMYLVHNDNLLYHGCIPMDDDGNFEGVEIGGNIYKGKKYLDYADRVARRAYSHKRTQDDLDFMWYLWCGKKSPLSGRNVRTFERAFIDDKSAWKEEVNPYYKHYHSEKTCCMILREFELYSDIAHIINGHTPVKTVEGESPIRANGKLIVIDGGFCNHYHKTTGIAGYTLIFNSHGLRIKSHHPFESIFKAVIENKDIDSDSNLVETERKRVRVKNTDIGRGIEKKIEELMELLEIYRREKY